VRELVRMLSFPETIRQYADCRGFGRKTVTGLGNTGKKFAISTVDDFLNIASCVSDAVTQSLS